MVQQGGGTAADVYVDMTDVAPCHPHYFRQVLAGPHENFHYVLGDIDTRRAAVIDPAFGLERLFGIVERDGFRIEQAWFTHGHWDHIGGIPDIFGLGVESIHIHRAAADHPKVQEAAAVRPGSVRLFEDGDTLSLGGLEATCLHTPGHQPEGSCFLTKTEPGALFGGDTLFVGSCGRTDFPGGDTDAMFASMARLRRLGEDVSVFPGHHYAPQPWRRLGDELRDNPALATTDRDAFGALHCLTH